MRNDCASAAIRDQLPDLLNDRVGPRERALVEAHLAGCADCRAELELLSRARGVLARAPHVDVASVLSELRSPRRTFWRAPQVVRGLAAAAVLAVVGAGVWVASRDDVTAPGNRVIAGQDADTLPGAVPAGDTRADGTPGTVLLAGASLSEFSDAELETLLLALGEFDGLPAEEPAPLFPSLELLEEEIT